MAKSVSIKNYQGIRNATLDLSDGVNVLIGESDVGKSSVVRAIRDFFYNADGDSFVTAGHKNTSVTVDDITWEKGKDVNRYIIGEKVYDRVGRGSVPEDVIAETKVREVEFGEGITRRLNVAGQFDGEFLVSDKGSDAAKIVGSLSGIGDVFNALREATSDCQKAKKTLETVKEQAKQAHDRADTFLYLTEASRIAESLVNERKSYNMMRDTCNTIRVQYNAIMNVLEGIKQAREDVERLKIIKTMDFEGFRSLKMRISKYLKLALEINGQRMETISTRKVISKIEAMRKNLMELEGVIERKNELSVARCGWNDSQTGLTLFSEQLAKSRNALDSAKMKLDGIVGNMTLCPVSGLELPDACRKAMKS